MRIPGPSVRPNLKTFGVDRLREVQWRSVGNRYHEVHDRRERFVGWLPSRLCDLPSALRGVAGPTRVGETLRKVPGNVLVAPLDNSDSKRAVATRRTRIP